MKQRLQAKNKNNIGTNSSKSPLALESSPQYDQGTLPIFRNLSADFGLKISDSKIVPKKTNPMMESTVATMPSLVMAWPYSSLLEPLLPKPRGMRIGIVEHDSIADICA